jgi:hypothetical protein
MFNAYFRATSEPQRRFATLLLISLAALGLSLSSGAAHAQSDVGGGDDGACVLKNHVYTCDGAAFQRALAGATTVAIETHNADGVARSQLKELVTKNLAKTVAPAGSPADLEFLLIPTPLEGVVSSVTDADLGTLRIYTSGPNGGRGHLLWAETFNGTQDLPWPAVVHGLILQFKGRFKIK